MGVVSECCCKEVYYRYPHNNYYFPPLVLYSSFFGSIIPISLFILKCFFVLIIIKKIRVRTQLVLMCVRADAYNLILIIFASYYYTPWPGPGPV